jgi:hypothetical protein
VNLKTAGIPFSGVPALFLGADFSAANGSQGLEPVGLDQRRYRSSIMAMNRANQELRENCASVGDSRCRAGKVSKTAVPESATTARRELKVQVHP